MLKYRYLGALFACVFVMRAVRLLFVLLVTIILQRLQQDIERNPSPPPAPVHEPPSNQSAFSSLAASAAVIEPPHSHSPTPTPSPSPPRHFSIRAQIDSDLVRKIYAENQSQRARAYCDIDAMLGLPNRAVLTSGTHVFDPYSLGMVGDETVLYTHVQDSPFFAANIRRFAQVKHLIVEKVREAYQKRQKLIHKAVRLERRLREVMRCKHCMTPLCTFCFDPFICPRLPFQLVCMKLLPSKQRILQSVPLACGVKSLRYLRTQARRDLALPQLSSDRNVVYLEMRARSFHPCLRSRRRKQLHLITVTPSILIRC